MEKGVRFVSTNGVKSSRTRNLLRGVFSNEKLSVRLRTLDAARKSLVGVDIKEFAKISSDADLNQHVYGDPFPEHISDVFLLWKAIDAITLEAECEVQKCRLEKHHDRLLLCAKKLGELNALILDARFEDANSCAKSILDSYGYSAALVRKLLYIHSCVEHEGSCGYSEDAKRGVKELLDAIFSENATSLLKIQCDFLIDLFDTRSDLFETINAQAKISQSIIHNEKDGGLGAEHVRKVRFPCLEHDVRWSCVFYAQACGSMVDTLVEYIMLSYSKTPPRVVVEYFESDLGRSLLKALNVNSTTASFIGSERTDDDEDVDIYRISSAMSECRLLYDFRRALDAQIIVREQPSLEAMFSDQKYFQKCLSLIDLVNPGIADITQITEYENTSSAVTLRSFAVLYCLNKKKRFDALDAVSIRTMLGQTAGFVYTLSVDEVDQIRDHGVRTDDPIISFLALIMINQRMPDDDRDFDLRMSFQKLLIRHHSGMILNFLIWLNDDTPGLCSAVVNLCDVAFLEKLYLIHMSYEEVLSRRLEICKWAAEALNNPQYLAVANQLAVDAKVRSIRGELDDSRIFVDEMRYMPWAIENLGPLLRRYQRHVDISVNATSNTLGRTADSITGRKSLGRSQYLYQVLSKAFEEFCLSRKYGIDSYLSRRIRHGTLVGQLLSPVRKRIDVFIRRYEQFITASSVVELERIYKEYSQYIHRLRDEKLHFKSEGKPDGLLNSDIYSGNARIQTFRAINLQFEAHLSTGVPASNLVELIPSTCWSLLETDLARAREELEHVFVHEVRPCLRQIGVIDPSGSGNWMALQNAVDQIARESFNEVVRWFYQPERSSMSVTIEQLAETVKKEINEYRPEAGFSYDMAYNFDNVISGMPYHTVYDVFFVLFDNAARHGARGHAVQVNAQHIVLGEGASALEVSVVSRLKKLSDFDSILASISTLDPNEINEEVMVREGKSGLGKACAIVCSYPGATEYEVLKAGLDYTFKFTLPIIWVGEG